MSIQVIPVAQDGAARASRSFQYDHLRVEINTRLVVLTLTVVFASILDSYLQLLVLRSKIEHRFILGVCGKALDTVSCNYVI